MLDETVYIIRDAAFGRDFTPKLWVSLVGIGFVLWDWRAQRRTDYAWVFLVGTVIWAGAELGLRVQGIRDMPERVLFGEPIGLPVSLLLQGMSEAAFIGVVGLFFGDRLLTPGRRVGATVGLAAVLALVTLATVRAARRLEGAEVVASRRDVADPAALLALAALAVVGAFFWLRWRAWRPRTGAMFAVMVALATVWTLGQVAVGGRWVEVDAAGGGYDRASTLVATGALAFDVVVEIAVAYVPFLALPVMAHLLRDHRPLVLPERAALRTDG